MSNDVTPQVATAAKPVVRAPPCARPVAYLLVRTIDAEHAAGPRMRTKLGCAIINNETVSRITENELWHLGGIIGHFDTMEQAQGFVSLWKGGVDGKSARGPMPRMSAGIALAQQLGVETWIDFARLVAMDLRHFRVHIRDRHIIAYDLTAGLLPVNA